MFVRIVKVSRHAYHRSGNPPVQRNMITGLFTRQMLYRGGVGASEVHLQGAEWEDSGKGVFIQDRRGCLKQKTPQLFFCCQLWIALKTQLNLGGKMDYLRWIGRKIIRSKLEVVE